MTMIRCKKDLFPYEFIEYIQGTGTQYINLGVSGRFRVKFDILYPEFPGGIIGGYVNVGNDYNRNYLVCYNNLITYGWGFGSAGNGFYEDRYNLPPYNTKLSCEYSTLSEHIFYKVNGVQNYANNKSNTDVTFNNYLGTINDNGNPGVISKYTLYGLKYYSSLSDDDLVMDLVPAIRKSDNVAGLYDKVNKTFLTNAGTGSFVVPS